MACELYNHLNLKPMKNKMSNTYLNFLLKVQLANLYECGLPVPILNGFAINVIVSSDKS